MGKKNSEEVLTASEIFQKINSWLQTAYVEIRINSFLLAISRWKLLF